MPSSADSPSNNGSTYRSEPVDSSSRKPSPLLAAAFVVGLLGFLLVIGRSEIARWKWAAAKNAMEDSQFEAAVEAATNGLKWNPEAAELIALRGAAREELGDFEGSLQDYDLMIANAAKDEEVNEADMLPLGLRSHIYQRMGRFEQAVADLTKVAEFRERQFKFRDDDASRQAFALSLNNRAYVQSLGKIDIEQALTDIQKAIDIRGVDDSIMLDTLGYLLLLNERAEEALEALEKAFAMTQKENNFYRNEIRRQMRLADDQRGFERNLKLLDENMAVIQHHRGEAYEAIGESEKAKADIEQAIKLGYDREAGVW